MSSETRQHGWHVERTLLARYADGDVNASTAASVEAHLLACADCRTALAPSVDPARLGAVWDEVLDRVDAPRRTVVERLLLRLGVAEHTARLVCSARSLTLSWLIAVSAALAFGLLAADAGARGVLLFLALAPIAPVAGVAAAYGREVDPTYEVGLAAPYSSFRLLLLRSIAVLASTLLIAGAAALLLPVSGWVAVAWLLPSLALTSVTLAASTRVDPAWAAAATVFAWLVAVFTAYQSTGVPYAAFGAAGQLVCTALLVLSVAVLIRRGRGPAPDLREIS
jgi:hypothetical protein